MNTKTHLKVVSQDVEPLPRKERLNEGNRLIEFLLPFTTFLKGGDGQHYVTFKESPAIAVVHDGPNSAAMQRICNRYFLENAHWSSSSAKAIASDFIHAQCMSQSSQDLAMRCAYRSGRVYLDTCWDDDSVIVVSDEGVHLSSTGNPVFLRGNVAAPLPHLSSTAAALGSLRHFIRIPEEALPALLAVLMNAMMPHLPQPIVLIQGPAAAGKTTALRFLLDLVDPSTSTPGGTLSANEREMRAISRVRRTFVFDNVSHLKSDVSDLLAKVTTGTEFITRALYQDSTPDVIQLKRPVFLNGIMNGFNRSDLASRTVVFNLEPIPSELRSDASQLASEWRLERSAIFTALLDLLSVVLTELPHEEVCSSAHRNPELVKITNIISRHMEIDGGSYLQNSIENLSHSVLGGTQIGHAFQNMASCRAGHYSLCNCQHSEDRVGESWITADQLRAVLIAHLPDEDAKWIPTLPKPLGESLQRIHADLEQVLGVVIHKRRTSSNMQYRLEWRAL